jgi:hypothetical protein
MRLPLAVLLGTVLVVGGCSSSPGADIIDTADEQCREISERFAGDLAFGESVGSDQDLEKLRERAELIRKLAADVRDMPPPETKVDSLNVWLKALDKYAEEMDNLRGQYQQARPGIDMLLAMQVNIIDLAAADSGGAADRFGFVDCADVGGWSIFKK